jgi:hypothetical protein
LPGKCTSRDSVSDRQQQQIGLRRIFAAVWRRRLHSDEFGNHNRPLYKAKINLTSVLTERPCTGRGGS